jgi:menaquinone-dependent protoporphyrinogen IX oxidase
MTTTKILLLYATREGQTAKIAGRVRGFLVQAGAQVTLANVTDQDTVGKLDLADFDLLVFGASIAPTPFRVMAQFEYIESDIRG